MNARMIIYLNVSKLILDLGSDNLIKLQKYIFGELKEARLFGIYLFQFDEIKEWYR